MPKADTSINIPIIRANSAADAIDNLLCLHKAMFLIWKDRGRGQASPDMDEEEANGLMMVADAIANGLRIVSRATHTAETAAQRYADMQSATGEVGKEGHSAAQIGRDYPRLDTKADNARSLPGPAGAVDGNAA